jgi:hypothetical protein
MLVSCNGKSKSQFFTDMPLALVAMTFSRLGFPTGVGDPTSQVSRIDIAISGIVTVTSTEQKKCMLLMRGLETIWLEKP